MARYRNTTDFVDKQVRDGKWVEEEIPANVVGLTRPIKVFRAKRASSFIKHDWHGDKNTYCPPIWSDIAISSGACGLGCRCCFLMLTFRILRDPLRTLLYYNTQDCISDVIKWLKGDKRKSMHTLGLGMDCSDSLLYEGITEYARTLAPIFANSETNPKNNKLILLTKTKNTHYLSEISSDHRENLIITFSLNPEQIADLWEGKWSDGLRITPPIEERLDAVKYAQDLGFDVRVRLDPILTPDSWQDYYRDFINLVKKKNIIFTCWTLGSYREKKNQLELWGRKWGIPSMEWQPPNDSITKDGTHYHMSDRWRIDVYQFVKSEIIKVFPDAHIGLCKETHAIRRVVGLNGTKCNCYRNI